jgi:hypothetical protein
MRSLDIQEIKQSHEVLRLCEISIRTELNEMSEDLQFFIKNKGLLEDAVFDKLLLEEASLSEVHSNICVTLRFLQKLIDKFSINGKKEQH